MYNYTLAPAYVALGHQVTVISSRLQFDVPFVQERHGVRIIRLLIRDAYYLRRLPGIGKCVRPARQLAYSWNVWRVIKELCLRQPIDIIEFAEVNAEGFFYARAPRSPFVVRCHTPTFVLMRYYQQGEKPPDSRITTYCEKDMIRRAHALTSPSHNMAKVIANECDVPIEKITVIPNAINMNEFSAIGKQASILPNGTVTVLHVGRLERVKGVTILARAIPRVISQVPYVHFVFIGEDRPTARRTSQRAELEAILTQANVRAHVEFLGPVDQAVLRESYRHADICVAPSMLYESFSYTCAQAMASGKPIVATRIGGVPETVDDGVNGILVEPGSAEQVADAIVRLARDGELRKRMGQAGREKAVRDFDVMKIAQLNLMVYENALARVKSTAR